MELDNDNIPDLTEYGNEADEIFVHDNNNSSASETHPDDGFDNDFSTHKTHTEPSYLSQSVHGSRRHLRNLAQNALTVISELGPPYCFLTLTCNTEWPEIPEMLLEGQTAFDRPDIVCRVFKTV